MNKDILIDQIKKLCKEKNAVIMAHYYQTGDIQDIADMVGDSLALAQYASTTSADIIILCGVHFMGETAKILSPNKKVLVPDLEAGCSLADSCPADKFQRFIKAHPHHTVITYVNTSAEIKALSDVVVTSTNAKKIVESFPQDEKIIFAPDKNLGNYINSVTDRNMLLWDGACHVHEQFSVEKLVELKKAYPKAKVLAHPECKNVVLILADFIGSTQALLNYATNSTETEFLVATESGILHQMQSQNPQKTFIPVPPIDSTCGCNDCKYMKLNTLEKIYNAILYEKPEITIDENIRQKAILPIEKMLKMSI